MRVLAVRTRYKNDPTSEIFSWKKGDVQSVQWSDFQPCCVKAQQAWHKSLIGFGERDTTINNVERVCVYACLPYPEGAVWDSMPIDFCPFCAAPVTLSVSG